MEVKVDIFLRLPDGKPLWVEAVEGYEKARLHVQKLIQASPGEYFIFDSRTGQIFESVAKPGNAQSELIS
jgi:hypothetical protein